MSARKKNASKTLYEARSASHTRSKKNNVSQKRSYSRKSSSFLSARTSLSKSKYLTPRSTSQPATGYTSYYDMPQYDEPQLFTGDENYVPVSTPFASVRKLYNDYFYQPILANVWGTTPVSEPVTVEADVGGGDEQSASSSEDAIELVKSNEQDNLDEDLIQRFLDLNNDSEYYDVVPFLNKIFINRQAEVKDMSVKDKVEKFVNEYNQLQKNCGELSEKNLLLGITLKTCKEESDKKLEECIAKSINTLAKILAQLTDKKVDSEENIYANLLSNITQNIEILKNNTTNLLKIINLVSPNATTIDDNLVDKVAEFIKDCNLQKGVEQSIENEKTQILQATTQASDAIGILSESGFNTSVYLGDGLTDASTNVSISTDNPASAMESNDTIPTNVASVNTLLTEDTLIKLYKEINKISNSEILYTETGFHNLLENENLRNKYLSNCCVENFITLIKFVTEQIKLVKFNNKQRQNCDGLKYTSQIICPGVYYCYLINTIKNNKFTIEEAKIIEKFTPKLNFLNSLKNVFIQLYTCVFLTQLHTLSDKINDNDLQQFIDANIPLIDFVGSNIDNDLKTKYTTIVKNILSTIQTVNINDEFCNIVNELKLIKTKDKKSIEDNQTNMKILILQTLCKILTNFNLQEEKKRKTADQIAADSYN